MYFNYLYFNYFTTLVDRHCSVKWIIVVLFYTKFTQEQEGNNIFLMFFCGSQSTANHASHTVFNHFVLWHTVLAYWCYVLLGLQKFSVLWHCWLGDRKGIGPVKRISTTIAIGSSLEYLWWSGPTGSWRWCIFSQSTADALAVHCLSSQFMKALMVMHGTWQAVLGVNACTEDILSCGCYGTWSNLWKQSGRPWVVCR